MRYAALLLFPMFMNAQPVSDKKVTEVLISEVQQLRVAVERSTFLNARVQLLASQLQIQETKVASLEQQYSQVRSGSAAETAKRDALAARVRIMEQAVAERDSSAAANLRIARENLAVAAATEDERSAKESAIAQQLKQAQDYLTELRNRATELERQLDSAIQQLGK